MTARTEVLLLIGTHCPYCSGVISSFGKLVKSGVIPRLEIINIEQHPDIAMKYGVRSIPWMKIGEITLTGNYSAEELREWIIKSQTADADVETVSELLNTSRVDEVTKMIRKDPKVMDTILKILAEPEAKFNVRLGIGVVMEEFEGSNLLKKQIKTLGKLTHHKSAAVRADACHYLGLSQSTNAISWLKQCTEDVDANVREIASDSLEDLQGQA